MPYSQSEAFLAARSQTKALRLKIMSDQKQGQPVTQQYEEQIPSASQSNKSASRTSFVNKIRTEAKESRNPEFKKLDQGH